MDALKNNTYTIYFGGSYQEHWSNDYRLTVTYSDRAAVCARRENGRWTPDSPLPALPLAEEYFAAACDTAQAMDRCGALGLDRGRIYEVFSSESPVAPFELMRALLDDWGFEFDDAIDMVVRCCGGRIDLGVSEEALCKLEPRTAHLIHILDTALAVRTFALHDSRKAEYRSPAGAVKTGDSLRLAVLDAGGGIPSAACVIFGDHGEKEYPMTKAGRVFSVDITVQDEPEALWYCFRLDTYKGVKWLCHDASGFYGTVGGARSGGFRLTVYDRNFKTPDWFKGGVMYQIFPDRFAFSLDGTAERGIEYHISLGQMPELHKNAGEPVRWLPRHFEKDYEPDDFYGGTLNGIAEKLPYLAELGVTVIYLNPIVEARSNHRYDTSDYMKVDPVLGTNDDFIKLCSEAEEFGMRIITDGVFSHTGADSVYFNRFSHYHAKGACQGPDSPYYKWYSFKRFCDKYKCWWNFPDLPEVNEEDPDWQDFVVSGENSVVKTWLRRGASGWRLDVADELPDDVLSLIRRSAKEEKPDALILGEVWEDAVIKESYGSRRRYALGNALDTVMNYPLRTAVLDFMHGHSDAYTLRDFLDGQRLNYPEPMYACLMNLMGSHDVERLRTSLSSDIDVKTLQRSEQASFAASPEADERAAKLERLCAAIQFSLPGVPSIYYGDELGMTGCRDPFNRLPLREGSHSPLEFYKELSGIRRDNIMSTYAVYFAACGPDVLLISRSGGGREILTAVNRSGSPRPVFSGKAGVDLISGEIAAERFVLPPYTAVILRLE